jgi:protein O-mannosyl-transferase
MKQPRRREDRFPASGRPASKVAKSGGPAKKRHSAASPVDFTSSALWGLAVLLAVTLAAYAPAWHGGMLWDDDGHITAPHLQSAAGLFRIWFEPGASQQYYPVLHSLFWGLHRLWGDSTLGYHLVTICLHATSAWMLGLILRRLQVPGAALAAVVFALHPVHVESVAWISETKNTLSGLFYLCAAMVYLRFDSTRRKWHYALAAALFVLALLSKSVTATLPVALLIVFWWRRGELRVREDIAPLVPFAGLGALAGLLTVWVERTYIGATGAEFSLSVIERFLVAGRAAWFYASKLLWPVDLMFTYPRWQLDPQSIFQLLFPLGVLVVLLLLWHLRRRSRGPLAAVLYFLVTLAPALGFVSVFPFRYAFVADHFQYLASIGIITLVCAGIMTAAQRWTTVPRFAGVAAPLILAVPLGMATWAQAHHYVDSDTLYRATIRSNPAAWMAHNNLAFDLQQRGMIVEAVAAYEEAIRIEPTAIEPRQNLAVVLLEGGRPGEAIPHLQAALETRPDFPKATFAMGKALASLDRPAEAIEYFNRTLSLQADYPEARVHLGAALEASGQVEAALKQYAWAVSLEPESIFAHSRYGQLLRREGRLEEAVVEFREVLRRDATFVGVHNELGVTLAQLGRTDEAVAAFRAAIRVFPQVPELRVNLGQVLLKAGRVAEAEAVFREAQQIK